MLSIAFRQVPVRLYKDGEWCRWVAANRMKLGVKPHLIKSGRDQQGFVAALPIPIDPYKQQFAGPRSPGGDGLPYLLGTRKARKVRSVRNNLNLSAIDDVVGNGGLRSPF